MSKRIRVHETDDQKRIRERREKQQTSTRCLECNTQLDLYRDISQPGLKTYASSGKRLVPVTKATCPKCGNEWEIRL